VWAHLQDHSTQTLKDIQIDENIWTFLQIITSDFRTIFEKVDSFFLNLI